MVPATTAPAMHHLWHWTLPRWYGVRAAKGAEMSIVDTFYRKAPEAKAEDDTQTWWHFLCHAPWIRDKLYAYVRAPTRAEALQRLRNDSNSWDYATDEGVGTFERARAVARNEERLAQGFVLYLG